MTSEELKNNLEEILTRNIDGELGYKEAETLTEDSSMKDWFRIRAVEREVMNVEIKRLLQDLGSDVNVSSTFGSAAHRTWMNIRANLSSDRLYSLLDECIRGDEKILELYTELDNKAPSVTKFQQVVSNHTSIVEQCLVHLRVKKEAQQLKV